MSAVRNALRSPTLLAALGALTLSGLARGESLYVVEQLVVNVNSAPDASGERIATVKSGQSLEVLERLRDQVHVRLADGRDGWIRASYLSADPPLRSRLEQRDAELTRLKAELDAARAALAAAATNPGPAGAAAPGAAGAAGSQAASAGAAPASAPAATPPIATDTALAGAAESSAAAAAEGPARPVWPWALGAAVAAFGLGCLIGAAALDRHIRRKYGGLRIY